MLTLIGFNLSLIVIFLIIYFVLWSFVSRNLFFNLTFFFMLAIVVAPIILSILNIVWILKNDLSIWSYLIPVFYISIPILKIFLEEKEQKRDDELYENYTPQLRLIIQSFFSELLIENDEEDIFIVKLDNKRNNKYVFKIIINLDDVQYNKDFLVKKLNNRIRDEIPDIGTEMYINVNQDMQKKSRFVMNLT
ncbi:RNA helicase (plasmid) [Bacillus mycoides]|uniref:RNA helicase n=1 Tax=Bacillus mycoides TaxID=1405 RepID=UPI001C00B047|nr:RNA helicase [Bacillus mycoides]QWH20713.1 RNA helicase [Bacillus mycoides]